MHEQVRLGRAALVLKIRVAALVDFTIEAIRAMVQYRPAEPHLVVELVAINPFSVDWISPMNGQEKVFAANGGARLLENVIELFHKMD